MSIDLDRIAETARRLKRDVVEENGDNPDEEMSDLRSFSLVIREGEQIAMIQIGSGPTGMRIAARDAAAYMRADEVVVVADARMRTYDIEEREQIRKNVRLGDYQRDWEAGRRDGMTECLVITHIPRTGDAVIVNFPYQRNGKTLQWGESSRTEKPEGAISDAVHEGYASAEKWENVPGAHLLGLSGLERDQAIDMIAAHYLSTVSDQVILLFDLEVAFEAGQATHVGG
jgi:alkanesulfonate monooxygenase SsuD/methylene tetrahydromethanopterin reductase-like flavin-dependent oxidoreductase (luciferase family)